MFDKILISNRGEIALRIINTCREMGIKTVAVYSDADKEAAHVISSDEAVRIGPSDLSLSYMNINNIIEAAKQTNANAIHPGYGFLSENHRFAFRCQNEGFIFIGPPWKVIKNFGNKITSRQIMKDIGVPVIPGITYSETDITNLIKDTKKIGYPFLVKAASGAGGKGIRIVNHPREIEEVVNSVSREALRDFGNGQVYLEKFFTKSKHIEFQILADKFGKIIHLFERECSIQRRHQKIIEETPSLTLTSELRQKMADIAVKVAKSFNYENAGTVEFLLDEENNFYFLEMNTRLQVEHPITEMITGIDLVKYQIEIAADYRMNLNQKDIQPRGHAIECRIYAEDPEHNFLPCPGKIKFIKEPKGSGIRVDSGIYQGFEIPINYDPILSKLIVHAETREQAINRLVRALQDYVILGVKTPIEFLIDIINSELFRKSLVFTDFIETHFTDWKRNKEFDDLAMIAFVADDLKGTSSNNNSCYSIDKVLTPFDTLGNWKI